MKGRLIIGTYAYDVSKKINIHFTLTPFQIPLFLNHLCRSHNWFQTSYLEATEVALARWGSPPPQARYQYHHHRQTLRTFGTTFLAAL